MTLFQARIDELLQIEQPVTWEGDALSVRRRPSFCAWRLKPDVGADADAVLRAGTGCNRACTGLGAPTGVGGRPPPGHVPLYRRVHPGIGREEGPWASLALS